MCGVRVVLFKSKISTTLELSISDIVDGPHDTNVRVVYTYPENEALVRLTFEDDGDEFESEVLITGNEKDRESGSLRFFPFSCDREDALSYITDRDVRKEWLLRMAHLS
jgi:hypothetical protein